MPLHWNIEHTEAFKTGIYKQMSSGFIAMIGMKVLNHLNGGYNYSFKWFVLDEKLANIIIKELLEEDSLEQTAKEEIKSWIPKLVEAEFIRLHAR
jgi:hypothetical protein